MDMASYLSEIRHACETILPSVWSEWDAVLALKRKIASLTTATVEGYRRAEAFQQSEDPDDYILGVGIHWDTYFGPDKERYQAEASLPDLEQRRDVRAFACTSLAGAVLQFAKQGISLVHDGVKNCPNGRIVHGVELKSVIWQGRNQSMHWEERRLSPAVRQCFEALKAADPALGDYLEQNVAFEVVRILGWREFADFEADLLALA